MAPDLGRARPRGGAQQRLARLRAARVILPGTLPRGLAALLAREPFTDAARALLEKVGATLYRVGLDGYED